MFNLKDEFARIILNEAALTSNIWTIPGIEEVEQATCYISEVAESSLVSRSYNNRCGLTEDEIAFESVGAHTNLMAAIVDRSLSNYYGENFDLVDNRYTYREVLEAVRLHDLPENVMGDIPDNGSRDASFKRASEIHYYEEFSKNYPAREANFKYQVMNLLEEMENQSSFIGKMLYSADKASAIIMTLQYDYQKTPPLIHINNELNSVRDLKEMALCDASKNGRYRASEMWTMDWFKMRELINFDTTGYITALIIMRTLQVNGRWYTWREKDYI